MVRKLGITGMDSDTEAELRTAFEQARSALGDRWELAAEADADAVIVDMDSMYGPMSWIRLHAAGKQVIGLTSSPRTQADHRLERPFNGRTLGRLLGEIETQSPADAGPAPDPAAVPHPADSPPSSATPAPAPADLLPEEQPAVVDEEAVAPPEPAAALEPLAAEPVAEPVPTPAPGPDPTLADWFAPGALTGRWRYERDGAGIVFDADARIYHGPGGLKPLAALFEGVVHRADLQPLDQDAWTSATTGLGAAQPLARLQWYAGLLSGHGALLPGTDPDGSYRLTKWPQTEREFPKHFRIATAMMKGPATVAEVAASSGVPAQDVADFINANLRTGYAELVSATPPDSGETPKPAGLFGRLRGR
jgi:hypothetical protein